jgi:hypothetical protein
MQENKGDSLRFLSALEPASKCVSSTYMEVYSLLQIALKDLFQKPTKVDLLAESVILFPSVSTAVRFTR